MTNPDNAVGTNGAYGGRTSIEAFNDGLAIYDMPGILNGWKCEPLQAMTVKVGGVVGVRDVAIAKNPSGGLVTINNISKEPISVNIPTASTEYDRTDAIVVYVNNPPSSSASKADNPDAAGIIAVAGNSSGKPSDGDIRAAITADGGTGTTAYYVVLAYVNVPQNATVITDVDQDGLDVKIKDARLTNLVEVTGDGDFVYLKVVSKDGIKTLKIATKFELVDEEEY